MILDEDWFLRMWIVIYDMKSWCVFCCVRVVCLVNWETFLSTQRLHSLRSHLERSFFFWPPTHPALKSKERFYPWKSRERFFVIAVFGCSSFAWKMKDWRRNGPHFSRKWVDEQWGGLEFRSKRFWGVPPPVFFDRFYLFNFRVFYPVFTLEYLFITFPCDLDILFCRYQATLGWPLEGCRDLYCIVRVFQ